MNAPHAIVLGILAMLVAHAYADRPAPAKKVDLAPKAAMAPARGGGGAEDLLSQTKFNPDSPPAAKNGVKLSLECTESGGRVLKQGEAGYDSCMSAAQTKIQTVSQPGGGPAAGATATVHFGN